MISRDGDREICYVSSGIPGKHIKSITDGMGIKTQLNYSPLSDTSVYTKQTGAAYPVIVYSFPKYVVSSIKSENGVADTIIVEYKYEGLKAHTQGKGFLGFSKTTKTSNLTNSVSIINRTYDNQFFHPYTISKESKVSNTDISKNSTALRFVSDSGFQYKVFVDTSISIDYLNDVTKLTTYAYDNNDQLSEKVTEIGSLLVATERYTYTDAGWFTDSNIESKTIELQRGSQSTSDSIHYQYQESTGLLIQSKSHCGTDKEVVKKFYDFTSHGNPGKSSVSAKKGLSLTLDSLVTEYDYTFDGRYLNSQSGPLNTKTYYEYDTENSLLTSQALPNGNEVSYEYGPFRSRVKSISADNMQSISKVYWSSGHPDAPTGSLYYTWASCKREVTMYKKWQIRMYQKQQIRMSIFSI